MKFLKFKRIQIIKRTVNLGYKYAITHLRLFLEKPIKSSDFSMFVAARAFALCEFMMMNRIENEEFHDITHAK